ncbi:hypothetical protein SAMN05192529_107118 [Arachidicoccus rhizosphaerae]|uniref:Uncharacterized protein n=1 Tax=Arachidicoccus rhizosphaerae TaxID=551991 RepID=A0A1H3Y7Q2_9BACT|nr:hypothetical protein SAMN05192529_107118 [Arachidicoccus rhizosphaerae]
MPLLIHVQDLVLHWQQDSIMDCSIYSGIFNKNVSIFSGEIAKVFTFG